MRRRRRVMLRQVGSGELNEPAVTAVRDLMRAAFGGVYTEQDLANAMGGVHVLAEEGGHLIAHAAVVPRPLYLGDHPVHAGYVEAVAVEPVWQRQHIGSRVMTEVAEVIAGGFQIGALSATVAGFYTRLGWEIWQGPTYVIGLDGVRRRAEEEDGGILVLRNAATRGFNLGWPIACHDRPGDAW